MKFVIICIMCHYSSMHTITMADLAVLIEQLIFWLSMMDAIISHIHF